MKFKLEDDHSLCLVFTEPISNWGKGRRSKRATQDTITDASDTITDASDTTDLHPKKGKCRSLSQRRFTVVDSFSALTIAESDDEVTDKYAADFADKRVKHEDEVRDSGEETVEGVKNYELKFKRSDKGNKNIKTTAREEIEIRSCSEGYHDDGETKTYLSKSNPVSQTVTTASQSEQTTSSPIKGIKSKYFSTINPNRSVGDSELSPILKN